VYEEWHRYAPVALAGYAPVGAVFDHGFQSRTSPGREEGGFSHGFVCQFAQSCRLLTALCLTQKLQDEVRADYDRYEFHLGVQKLLGFCSETLGSFYLDILKDRLYTSGENSKARRSAQNALYHITHALTRLIAPILSFTAEEAWTILSGNDEVSIFEGLWHELPDAQLDEKTIREWELLRSDRDFVNKKIEELRSEGKLGSALQAELTIRRHFDNDYNRLNRLDDELRYVLIVSKVTLEYANNIIAEDVIVTPSPHDKCERCWHYREDVGRDEHHSTLCGRCVSNLYGSGEARRYA